MDNKTVVTNAVIALILLSSPAYAQGWTSQVVFPELTTIGAGIAILGSALYSFYRRRHRKY